MATKNDLMGLLSAHGIYHEESDTKEVLERIAREKGLEIHIDVEDVEADIPADIEDRKPKKQNKSKK